MGRKYTNQSLKEIEVQPIGIMPLFKEEGYLFLQPHLFPELSIYQYQLSIFSNSSGKYRGLNLTFLEKAKKNLGQTYENIKLRLIKQNTEFTQSGHFFTRVKNTLPLRGNIIPNFQKSIYQSFGKCVKLNLPIERATILKIVALCN